MKGSIKERSPGPFAIILETARRRDKQAKAHVAQLQVVRNAGNEREMVLMRWGCRRAENRRLAREQHP